MFLDALASLDFKLSLSQCTVIDIFRISSKSSNTIDVSCASNVSNASNASNAIESSASMSRLLSYFCWFKGLSRELTA